MQSSVCLSTLSIILLSQRFGLVNNFFHWKGKFKSKSISRGFYGSLGLLSIIYLLRFHSWKLCVSIRFISHFWSKINKLCWGQGGLQEECLRVEGVCSRIETVYSSRSSCFPVLKPDTSEGIARDLSDVIS